MHDTHWSLDGAGSQCHALVVVGGSDSRLLTAFATGVYDGVGRLLCLMSNCASIRPWSLTTSCYACGGTATGYSLIVVPARPSSTAGRLLSNMGLDASRRLSSILCWPSLLRWAWYSLSSNGLGLSTPRPLVNRLRLVKHRQRKSTIKIPATTPKMFPTL